MIRTIISDIGNVLSGFTWYDFYKSKGYSEEWWIVWQRRR